MITLLAAAIAVIQASPVPRPLMDNDAYAVYAVALATVRPERRVPPAPLIIQSETEHWDPPNCFPEPIKPEWREVLEDYRRQNAKRRIIEPRLQIDLPHQLLSKDALRAFLPEDKRGSMELFDRTYPGAGGYLTLSAVGFSADRSRAMLYVSHFCGGLCGSGWFSFFEKINGRWQRTEAMTACVYVL
jgi:hypothetical protein